MKEYLARTAKRAVATGLVAATLLGGLVGCNKTDVNNPSAGNYTEPTNEIADGTNHEPFEALPIRPIEDIKETGITADDVLAAYDKLALAIEKKRYPRENVDPDYLEAYDKATAQFESITVETYEHPVFEIGGDVTLTYYQFPFFIKRSSFRVGEPGEQIQVDNKIYTCSFHYNIVNNNKYYNETFGADGHKSCGIIDYEFEDVMKSFNSPPSTITEDKLALGPFEGFFELQLGQTCYAPMKIDRELIQSANEEQLWALYNMIHSIYSINIEEKLPENQEIDSEMEN